MKKEWQGWSLRFLLLLVLLTGLGIAHWQTDQWRRAVLDKQQQLDLAPVQDSAATSLRADLRRKQPEIERVLQLVPTREEVVKVVTAIEEEGKRRSLETAVVDIQEQATVSQEGAIGPLRQVELHVLASGNPADLLEFLYALEHLPYLLHGNDWRLLVGGVQVQARGSGAVAPIEEEATAGTVAVDGKLTVNLVLTVRNEGLSL